MKELIYPFLDEGNPASLSFWIAGISYCDGSYRIRRQNAGTACIEYILRGRGTVLLDGVAYTPKAGDTYFLPTGHDHLYYADPADPWEKIWVNFSGVLAAELAQAYGITTRCHFPGLYTGDLLRSIVRTAEKKEKNQLLSATLLLHELFYRMGHADAPHVDKTAAALRDFIDLHYCEDIRAGEIAGAVGRSASQCCRVFRRAYGCTPYQYLLRRRLSLACQLLESSRLSVREIAAQLSFCDEYYFSGLFKEKTGVSPAAYRDSRRGKP